MEPSIQHVISLSIAVSCLGLGFGAGHEVGQPCTYFGGARISSPEDNLVNCSWYASNACCKRTEVTSVFGSMLPLYGTTKECADHINYLMCYFCSPEQHIWYQKTAYICAKFCEAVYENCKTASYDESVLGEHYANGEEFCLGQKFSVVENNNNCFAYDPTVFGRGASLHPLYLMPCGLLLILLNS